MNIFSASSLDIDELAVEEGVVGGEVEQAVAGVVEQDDPLLPSLLGRQRLVDRPPDGMGRLGGGDRALAAGELHCGLEHSPPPQSGTNGSASPARLEPPPQEPRTTSGRPSPACSSCCLASRPMTVWWSSTWLRTEPSE